MAEDSPENLLYLHGDLDLKIIAARKLPNMDLISARLRRCFTVCKGCFSKPQSSHHAPSPASGASDLAGDFDTDRKAKRRGKIITSDPYVAVVVPQATIARTRVIRNSQNPKWDEHFLIPIAHPLAELEFQVKDNDALGAQLIGTVRFPAAQIATGERISGWFTIRNVFGNPPKRDTALRLEMRFTPCDGNPLYSRGIADDPNHAGVRNTYFPVRRGGSVTLYQDAHVPDDLLPQIQLDGEKVFSHEKCWEDLCYSISEAHHLIYVVGWSISHKIKLVREPTRPLPRGGNLSLGELLKYKSEEGVRVLLLVWDDKTSHKYFIKKEGVMQTHDEETRKFFKHSSVTCVLAPRYASSKLSLIKQQVVGTLFTHHQKCVLVDTQAHGSYRKITAFLGGLDLCDGRYDTPEHRIFRDLNTVFQDDFHNPTFPSGTRAPRQPWHDLHCKVDGPAAYDVLINFEQRWRRATRFREFSLKKRITTWHDDALIKINRISWILCPVGGGTDTEVTVIPAEDHSVWVSKETDPDTWHVQVFRSIDSGSLNGFSKAASDVYTKNLICSKDLVIDKSIQTAYIQAIRSAQHFIYIENQYFLGSSYGWPSYKNAGADNLIPMELALKIASKIKAKERFAVYVVIPLWPEGDPRSASVQEILYWQSQTMEMMYGIVARELKNLQLEDSSPEDYLNFYCLGNREEIAETSAAEVSSSDDGAKVSDAMRNRRFMIYVHAKGMIVDDEYVILGSANINQRSLAGSKDTEIAIGAYQPHQTWGQKKKHPRGQVYGYRMSLWAEHLGTVDPDFNEPETLECVHKVNTVANDNWKRFTGESFATLQGHLLKYPLQVSVDGKVESLPDEETFPDVGGKIIGSPSPALPDILTT